MTAGARHAAPAVAVKYTPAWWAAILNSRFVLRHPPLRWRLYGLGRWLQGYRYHRRLGWIRPERKAVR